MKKISLFFAFIFFVSCNNSQKNIIPEEKGITNTIWKDISKNKNVKTIQIKKDSIFLVKALPFEVNGIKCNWEYKIKESDQNMFILNQKLKSVATNSILFETTNEVDNSNKILKNNDIVYIKTHQLYNLECVDINSDGFCDFKILIERAAAGANQTYEVFLFNSKNKKFEYSKVFSETNVEYDKEKNRISFMWKMGAGSYSFGYANLKKDKRDVAFFEDINQNQDTIIYTKSIGKKIIERKKVVLKKEEWQGNEVNPEDSQYLLERNKK